MSTANGKPRLERRKLRLERMERRECPTGTVVPAATAPPPAITADLTHLTADLNKAATDFLNKAPVATEIHDTLGILADTTKLSLDVRAATHAGLGGVLAPLVSLEIDEATLYFDFATGNTAGAKTAAANELNDLQTLGNSLAGHDPGLATSAFDQAETAFNSANDVLFGSGGGGPVGPPT
jgi:hypothetical protein